MAKYKCGDIVTFVSENQTVTGSIVIVDANGTWDNSNEPSYDVLGNWEGRDTLFKHIGEHMILKKV